MLNIKLTLPQSLPIKREYFLYLGESGRIDFRNKKQAELFINGLSRLYNSTFQSIFSITGELHREVKSAQAFFTSLSFYKGLLNSLTHIDQSFEISLKQHCFSDGYINVYNHLNYCWVSLTSVLDELNNFYIGRKDFISQSRITNQRNVLESKIEFFKNSLNGLKPSAKKKNSRVLFRDTNKEAA